MRLANAIALLAVSLFLGTVGSQTAEARRLRYESGGHRAWHHPGKRVSVRRMTRQARYAAVLADRRARMAAIALADREQIDRRAAIVAATAKAEAQAQDALAASVARSVQTVPPPPGPTLVNTVTYDFQSGTKTTSLTDGATFVETFDPKAFFRMAPEAGPLATSSTVAAAARVFPGY